MGLFVVCFFFLVDKDELREELREDKAVKVSRKELNKLFEELSEFTDIYNSNLCQRRLSLQNDPPPQITVLQSERGDDGLRNNKTDAQVVCVNFFFHKVINITCCIFFSRQKNNNRLKKMWVTSMLIQIKHF